MAASAHGRVKDDSRTALEPLPLQVGAGLSRNAAGGMHRGHDNELPRAGTSHMDHVKDQVDASLDGKWPRHLSRRRELEALNRSLLRGKENCLLGVNFA